MSSSTHRSLSASDPLIHNDELAVDRGFVPYRPPSQAPTKIDLLSRDPLPDLTQADLPEFVSPVPDDLSLSSDHSRAHGARQQVDTSQGPVWIEGDCIMCACPDCGAPMTVRLWLLIADCWKCRISIELSEEQHRAIQQLLKQRGTVPAETAPPAARQEPAPQPSRPHPAEPLDRSDPQRRRQAAETASRQRMQHVSSAHTARAWIRDTVRMTPAWLISFLIHFVALLLLALITLPEDHTAEAITISTFVDTRDLEGGDLRDVDPNDEVQFELPLPYQAQQSNQNLREALVRADQDAKLLRVDPNPAVPLPDLESVKDRITTRVGPRPAFVARDPRVRVEMVTQEGGTTLTEAAVSRGLRWLANHQNHDGSWSLAKYERSNRRSNRGDMAATSLALLPFLGAGQTHEYGVYKETVAKGLKWMVDHQKPNGDLRDGLPDPVAMYAHGQGAIVLVEALALTGDERFRQPAQKAIDFIVKAQYESGGWRYVPADELRSRSLGDTSVFGWQLMALQSARSPGVGLQVPDETLKLSQYYLDLASDADGALYRYLPRRRDPPTPAMTAEALLCRVYLGWKRDDPRLRAGIRWLIKDHMPSYRDGNVYYWYYATQLLHHYGGNEWKKWNLEMRDILVNLQEKKGRHAGSWEPGHFEWGRSGERVYVTALAVCILEVYYRHLPLFKQIDLELD